MQETNEEIKRIFREFSDEDIPSIDKLPQEVKDSITAFILQVKPILLKKDWI